MTGTEPTQELGAGSSPRPSAWDAWNWQPTAEQRAEPTPPPSAAVTERLPAALAAAAARPGDPGSRVGGGPLFPDDPALTPPPPQPARPVPPGAFPDDPALTAPPRAPTRPVPSGTFPDDPALTAGPDRTAATVPPGAQVSWLGTAPAARPHAGAGGVTEPMPTAGPPAAAPSAAPAPAPAASSYWSAGPPVTTGGPGWGGGQPPYPSHPSVPPAPGRDRGPGWPAVIGVSALTGLIAALAGAGLGASLAGSDLLPTAAAPSVSRPAGSIAAVAAKAIPSVVTIRATGGGAGGATGSGFVYDTGGHIVTNNHVVEGVGDRVTVVLSDNTHHDASLVGQDATYDIAVLKIEASGLTALPMGDSTTVVPGDEVLALGAPLGLESTVTSGIVSAVDRPVVAGDGNAASYINAIQTDAAINPGNSGGPLIDMAGNVIGVNSAIATPPGTSSTSAGSIGLGFAIPSAQVVKTADQLIATGSSEYPVIGVILDRTYAGPGARVQAEDSSDGDPVSDEGPADQAGVQPGDVIVGFDGQTVSDADDLIVAIRAKNVGDTVSLTLDRDGRRVDVTLTLQAAK